MSTYSLLASWFANWHFWAMVLALAIALWSFYVYRKEMLNGETRPNAVSFFLWTLCQCIAFVAQLQDHPSFSIGLMAVLIFNTGAILWYSLRGYGYKEYGWFDALSLVCSILAIVLWQQTSDLKLGISFSILADLAAVGPTVKKIWEQPQSESLMGWLLIAAASLVGAFASEVVNFANLVFPIYVFLITLSLFFLIYLRKSYVRRHPA